LPFYAVFATEVNMLTVGMMGILLGYLSVIPVLAAGIIHIEMVCSVKFI